MAWRMKISQHAAKLAECFARNPGKVLSLALLLSLLAGWAAAQLPVITSRQALLPQNTAVAKRFNNFLKDFGAASDLLVVLEGAPPKELEAFADQLAVKLRTEPEIAQATAHLDMGFFLNYAYLLMPEQGLQRLEALAKQAPKDIGNLEQNLGKIQSWSQKQPSLSSDIDLQSAETSLKLITFCLEEWQRWLNAETAPSHLDWSRLMLQNGAGGSADGYFTSRDGRMLFMFIHPKNSGEDFETLAPLLDKVKQTAAALAQQTAAAGHTPPTVGLTGLPAMEYEEYLNIRHDITLVIGSAIGLILVLILLVVRSVRWAALIFIPMGLGVLWSLGLALITVGHLTIITATFIAILFGLGADYGIFTSSRIAEERRTGKPLPEAIGAGIGSSFLAVLTAGVASLLIFGALATVDFPGFAELGVVASKGVLMILIATWLVQPALYALLPPKLKTATPTLPAPPSKKSGEPIPKPVALGIVILALAGAIFGGLKGFNIPFDYDILALLPKDSEAAYYQRRMVEESDFKAEVIIFTAKDMAEARRMTLEAGKLTSIAQVQSLTSLFPPDADARTSQAVSIATAFSHANYGKQLAALAQSGLSPLSYQLLQTVLKNAIVIVDDGQEQAYSAGHGQMVESLGNLSKQLAAISSTLNSSGEPGRLRSESFLRALLSDADAGLNIIAGWQMAQALTPSQLPDALRDRFFAADGSIAVYAFPTKTVYNLNNLDALMKDVYGVSPKVTGFPATHQEVTKLAVSSFSQGTQSALALCLLWILAATRSLRGFTLAALPLLIGGGWMLGVMVLAGINYNYANMVALPMVIALAVDYGVWFNYRWHELQNHSPLQVSLVAGRVIGLAAGTELAGLGAITLASYRGVSSLGVSITIGLLCCLTATLVVAPLIGQLLDPQRKT